MPKEIVRGAPLPAPGAERTYPCVWPQMGEPLDVVCLSDWIEGYWVHWVGDLQGKPARTFLCPDEPGACPYCQLPRRWQGYLGVWSLRKPSQLAIVVLSADAARHMIAGVSRLVGLRGTRWDMVRTGNRPNGPVQVTLSQHGSPQPLPAPIALGHSLRLMFGVARLPGDLAAEADVPREGV